MIVVPNLPSPDVCNEIFAHWARCVDAGLENSLATSFTAAWLSGLMYLNLIWLRRLGLNFARNLQGAQGPKANGVDAFHRQEGWL